MWARVYVVVCFMWRNCGRSVLSRTLIAQWRRQSTTYTKITDSMRPNFVITSFASSSSISMLSTFVLNSISRFSTSFSRFVHFLMCAFSLLIRWSCQVVVSMCLVSLTITERKKRQHALFLLSQNRQKETKTIFSHVFLSSLLFLDDFSMSKELCCRPHILWTGIAIAERGGGLARTEGRPVCFSAHRRRMHEQGTVTAGFRSKSTCCARVRLPPLDVWETQLEVPLQVFI